jgi:3-oxoacid CoA-transferase subunit A
MQKVVRDADAAVEAVADGATIMMGGFGVCGVPEHLIAALHRKGVRDLTIVSNNAGTDEHGVGVLLKARQIRKMIATYERIRAGGAGSAAFFTPTGVGTVVAEGKEVREFDGRLYVMERGLRADFAFVKAWTGDTAGNLVYRRTTRNFNPMMATAATTTIAEVEHLVEAGRIAGDHVHTPGIFVQHILQGPPYSKKIEKRTVRG